MITHIMSNQDKYTTYNTKQWYLNTLSDRQLRGIIAGNKTQTLEAQEARKEKCCAYNRNHRLRKATRAPAKATAEESATKSFEIEVRIEDPLVHLESTRASVRNVIATELVQCLGSS